MSHTEVHLDNLAVAAEHIPSDQPIVMLNLIRFKPEAQYIEGSDLPPCSGSEAWMRYRTAFGTTAKSLGISVAPIFLSQVHTGLVIGSEKWDTVVLVKYSNFTDFRAILESEAYIRDAQPHRIAAMDNFRLFAMTEIPLPK